MSKALPLIAVLAGCGVGQLLGADTREAPPIYVMAYPEEDTTYRYVCEIHYPVDGWVVQRTRVRTDRKSMQADVLFWLDPENPGDDVNCTAWPVSDPYPHIEVWKTSEIVCPARK